MTTKNENKVRALRIIFFTQVGLLALMGVLFAIGHADNGVNIGAFFFSIILGTLGASISFMRRINADEKSTIVQLAHDPLFSTLMPILYGTLMAGVAYLLFMSGLVSGDGGKGLLSSNLFPNFSQPHEGKTLLQQFIHLTPHGMKNTGKLLVWSFIAGYSERFVVAILDQLERKGGGEREEEEV